jgi:hypothetical protein
MIICGLTFLNSHPWRMTGIGATWAFLRGLAKVGNPP